MSPSSICFIASGILACFGISGWGWFLFVGVILL
nr:MAG TPA: hypothetical protein [Caudoviricetes sp.]